MLLALALKFTALGPFGRHQVEIALGRVGHRLAYGGDEYAKGLLRSDGIQDDKCIAKLGHRVYDLTSIADAR
jgi:hypothetical protein